MDVDPYANDAFKQYYNLLDKFTQEYEVRPDIEVHAYAWDRSVELVLLEKSPDRLKLDRAHSTGKRNIATMRELAQALLDACDFVEQHNPEWASHGD
jgi:hypothetical protein